MTRYEPAVDLAAIQALDMHTHVHSSVNEDPEVANKALAAMAKCFKSDELPPGTLPDLAEYYRKRNIAAVTFTVDQGPSVTPQPVLTSDEIVDLAAANNDVIIPFASVHPDRGEEG